MNSDPIAMTMIVQKDESTEEMKTGTLRRANTIPLEAPVEVKRKAPRARRRTSSKSAQNTVEEEENGEPYST